MKIENFQKAKEIKEKIDALQEQLEQVKIAINQNKKPSGENFEVVNFKFTYIKWEYLDWRKMLFEAETTLCSQIANLKFQFETLE